MRSATRISHLAVCDGVVVDAHLRVDVFKIPAEAPALQPLPQGQSLRDISEIHAWVLSTNGAQQRQGVGVWGGEKSLLVSRWAFCFKRRKQNKRADVPRGCVTQLAGRRMDAPVVWGLHCSFISARSAPSKF